MIEETNLIEGKCYFFLAYHDQDLRIPDIRTLIYIGKEVDKKSTKKLWCFQEPASYVKRGSAMEKKQRSKGEINRVDEESLFSIYDWNGLIKELQENKHAQDAGKLFD